jgi:prefoldin alpha subunit
MSQSPPGQGQQIDLHTLSTQQLSQLQSRLSQELDHLTQSYARLRQAQGRFRDCIRAIQEGVQGKGVGESFSLLAFLS